MLYNGKEQLIYYSSMAGRVFLSNAGAVATVAVSGYFFPEETVAGIAGAVAIRSATWLTKKVDEAYHVHIADAIDRLLDVAPAPALRGYVTVLRTVGSPQRAVSQAIATSPQLRWVNESLATELLSPLLEEVIFRVAAQEGLALGLMAAGVPRGAAGVLSGAISAALFAGAHSPNPRDKQYRDTLISGIGFGLMMHSHGLPAAIVSHSANNVGVRFENALRR
jgi:hypothetical protein